MPTHTSHTSLSRMVAQQIAARGVRDEHVLEAMRKVPRENFVATDMQEFAFEDAPLPIGEGQTISQPFIVALMAEALQLKPGDKVLEIGTGSGYAAAVLGQIAAEVYTVERYESLAETAKHRFDLLGYHNIHVLLGDGTRGWPEHAPYDGIVVAAGGPRVPEALQEQLAIGGHLLIPVGPTPRSQELLRITRISEDKFEEESLGAVRFVPLVGEEGWQDDDRWQQLSDVSRKTRSSSGSPTTKKNRGPSSSVERDPVSSPVAEMTTPALMQNQVIRFDNLEDADLSGILERIGNARVVLLGEATHGTSEFYRMRARITQALITHKGFNIVAAEADWPDAARIDHYIRDFPHAPPEWKAFARFPLWMWRNQEVEELVSWLRDYNSDISDHGKRVGFYGLDLYSMYNSIDVVLRYLDDVDPEAADVARERYGCLSPWENDPATYGRSALRGRFAQCENKVVEMLREILSKQAEYLQRDGERFLDAVQNARLIASAEQYYRTMYYGSAASWNLRDQHMFDTLRHILDYRGSQAKAVVWAHNSHLGDASATEMKARGEHNLGQLCRQKWDSQAYLIGFGTDRGTVAAASTWGAPVEIMQIRPSYAGSYERLCLQSQVPNFFLPLRQGYAELKSRLMEPRLERAIGVIYRPLTELQSHYFQAVLPRQFDEYIWFEQTEAVTPLDANRIKGELETWPFGI